jgi:hypothetical protein
MKPQNYILLIGLLLITQNVSATVISNNFAGQPGQSGSFAFPQGFPDFGGFDFFGSQRPTQRPQPTVPSPNPQAPSPIQQPQVAPRPPTGVLTPQFQPSIPQPNPQAPINPLQPI